nr:hypothetical protein [Pseudomonas sp. Leaf58]
MVVFGRCWVNQQLARHTEVSHEITAIEDKDQVFATSLHIDHRSANQVLLQIFLNSLAQTRGEGGHPGELTPFEAGEAIFDAFYFRQFWHDALDHGFG